MKPQARGVVLPETGAAIREAQQRVVDAELEMKRFAVQALVDGASYPELTKATAFRSQRCNGACGRSA